MPRRKKAPARKPKPKPPPKTAEELPPTGVLDWTHDHWAGIDRKCRYCPGLTPLRDSQGNPAHKVCAENALRQQVEDYAAAYEKRFL